MAPMLRLHRSVKRPATKLPTTDVSDGKVVHLALASPPSSDRPSVHAVTSEVKKPIQKATAKNTSELAEVLELLKLSEGGKNMETLRQRRQCKEYIVAKVPENVIPPSEDTIEVNALLKSISAAKEQGKGARSVLRERRRSRETSLDLTGDTNTSPRSDTGGEGESDAAKPKQQESEDAPETKEDEASLARPAFARPRVTLSGAAARGVQQAGLRQVKEAAQTTGGVFLTATEYEAIKSEIALLHVKNKRLTQENAHLKSAKSASMRSASPASPSLLRRQLSPASPTLLRRQLSLNVARAIEIVSPLASHEVGVFSVTPPCA